MTIKKYYKILKPKSEPSILTNNPNSGGASLFYGNYDFNSRFATGASNRISRYKEMDLMTQDIDVHRALDIITQEICGNPTKLNDVLQAKITAGYEQQVPSRVVVTLKAALKTWCNLQQWDTRLPFLVKSTLKYGDCFLLRPKGKNEFHKKLKFIHPRQVAAAITDEDDINSIRGWKVQTEFNSVANAVQNSLYATNNQSMEVMDIPKDDIVVFSNNDETSESAPFGHSIFNEVYTTFKQKEMIEVALIIYRVQRAHEKRVFYLDMEGVPVQKRKGILEEFKSEIKQKRIPSAQGGKSTVDSIYNPSSMSEDFYMTNNKNGGNRIEVLPGGQNLGNLEDLEFFTHKMWRGLRIPQSYMDNTTEGGSVANEGRVGIAYLQEIKFTLYIQQLQKIFERVLDAEFKRFLYDMKLSIDPTIFKVILPEPNNFSKSREHAINNDLVNVFTAADGITYLSPRFKLAKFMQLSQDEILINERLRCEELGLDPNNSYKNLGKIYGAEGSEDASGFDGGMGASGLGGDVGPSAMDSDLDSSEEAEIDKKPDNAKNDTNSQTKNK